MGSLADLHMHSAASDGTDTPGELMERAAGAGVRIFALTDHDTVDGVDSIRGLIPDGMVFIPGVEFSCRMETGECHILGYGYDRSSGAFQRILDEGGRLRRGKLELRLEFLKSEGAALPEEETERLRAMPSAGKPHIARSLVKYGFAKSMAEAMAAVDRCPASRRKLPAGPVIEGIRASGGIPVWAHPLGGEGEREAGEEQFSAMLSELLGYGLVGMECFYSKYPMEVCEGLERAAARRGLLVSGGSDYHGTNKTARPGELDREGAAVPVERLTVLSRLFKEHKYESCDI